jgi:hypothetical protein
VKIPDKSKEAISEKKRKKEPQKNQLGLFDQVFDDGADEYPRKKIKPAAQEKPDLQMFYSWILLMSDRAVWAYKRIFSD